MMSRVMLARWANTIADRRIILAFWEHLEQIGSTCLMDIHIDKELDRYHGIDQARLERERRQLLKIPEDG